MFCRQASGTADADVSPSPISRRSITSTRPPIWEAAASPPKDVSVGDQTNDEMLFGFLGATSTKTPWVSVRTSAYPPPGVAFDPPAKGELTAELERRLGEWDSVTVAKPLGGAETKLTGKESVERAFGGTHLLIRSQREGEGGVVEAPISRNAPCPCGSGKKYKHCHGQLA